MIVKIERRQGQAIEAAIGQSRVLFVAAIIFMAWVVLLSAREPLSYLEAKYFPTVTNFTQNLDVSYCDGSDAIVFGTMNKLRGNYISQQHQTFYFLKDQEYQQRAFVTFLDQPENQTRNRSPHKQTWGPWLLHDACSGEFDAWATSVGHESFHPFWILKTSLGPFDIPSKSVAK